MKILSDALMGILYNLQKISFACAGNAVGVLNYEAYGCRNACSGSCERSCDGACDRTCVGGCQGSWGYD